MIGSTLIGDIEDALDETDRNAESYDFRPTHEQVYNWRPAIIAGEARQ